MNVSIDVSEGSAGPALRNLVEQVAHRRPLNAALGKRGEVELREHFLKRNQEPNKSGFPSANFWNRIRKATALAAVDSSGATIAIADPAIDQKIFGGTIKPKEGKYLTLPALAAAYGQSPLTFSNLEVLVRWKDGERRAVALAERRATQISFGGKRKDGSRSVKKGAEVGGQVFYWLVESVTQKKDPRALPKTEVFESALLEETGFFIQDILR